MSGDVSDSKTKCFVNHAYEFCADESRVSAAYLRCANMAIWAQENDPDQYHPDELFMPIVYLYRHSIELALKSLICTIVNCGRLAKSEKKKSSGHNIIGLWKIVKPVLLDTWPKADKKPVNNTEGLLNELQRIDKSGQNLRYAHNKEGGKTSLNYPKVIRLELLCGAMNEVHTFITSCDSYYYDEWQSLPEEW
ncbi:hypothetical protein OOT00_15650 [Desulfobotulus sp. H1]|uniref:HEPN domain-containing protein n=1 Tax=Desulfobotulus pelophilus TaxID=2823377 RepID=A0ABT3NE05_9BACT|nr:hypothetical protein [Desulfobotulus pelophilus]MCW7755416.1 hypothetical protein [Desulfobotulus pelophilus]